MAKKAVYKALGILGVVVVFVAGVWLGRLYSAAGGPGVATLQEFGSGIVRQIRQLWESVTPISVPDSGSDVPRVNIVSIPAVVNAAIEKSKKAWVNMDSRSKTSEVLPHASVLP